MDAVQLRRRFDQSQVQRVFSHTIGDGFRIGDRHMRLHVGMQRLELAENLRQIELGHRGARPQQQGAADGAGQLADAGFQFLRQRQDLFSITKDQFTSRGQRNTAVIALKQPRIEMFFQLLYLESDRRLGHEQLFGSLGKR